MKSINYQQVPSTIEEDINKGKTEWKNGAIYKIDEGRFETYFIGHKKESTTDEDGVESEIMVAFPVRVKKPFSIEKAVVAATMSAYSITSDEAYYIFLNRIFSLYRNDPENSEVMDYDAFCQWVKNCFADNTEVEIARQNKINEINVYDKSKAVNGLTYQGQFMWLSREDRLALTDRFTRELAAGVKTTNLFYQGVAIAVTPQEGLDLVAAVATYADECFDNTQKNIGKVMAAKTVKDVEAIDITEGYPSKLKLAKP